MQRSIFVCSSDQSGVALILMMWVLALLSVIAAEFCHSMRAEATIVTNFKNDTQAFYLAEAGAARGIMEILKIESTPQVINNPVGESEVPWRVNYQMPAIPFGEGSYQVWLENESGKVNLNYAEEPLLRLMLNTFDMDEGMKDVIVDSILDWRDKDSLHRANGAEDDYYRALPKPYNCKNGDFEDIGELLLVRGVTPELFNGGLKELVTVVGKKELIQKEILSNDGTSDDVQMIPRVDFNKINVNAASPRLLKSLPGITPEMVDKIAAYRKEKDLTSFSDLLTLVGGDAFAGTQGYLSFSLSPYYVVHARGGMDKSMFSPGIRLVVKIDKRLPLGYQIIQRLEN